MTFTKKKVAIVGTNGIPARYGGYETLAEYLTKFLCEEFDFTIYCSKSQPKFHKELKTTKLIYVPLNANGWKGIIYDIITLFHSAIFSDVILYLGPGAGFIVPIIKVFKKSIIINHGGLNEWEREKYSTFQKKIAKIGHKYAAKYANFNIADNLLLKNSIKKTFNVDAIVIRYGGDHAVKIEIDNELINKYPFLLKSYYVNVSRAQIDNNLHLVLESFKSTPEKTLVMISNWSISDYGIELKKMYNNKYENIQILDAIYEPKDINAIRGNATAYIHSHSYCGTSPSLVEAMSLGLPIISFDVPTNRETTQNKAFFFKSSSELIYLINKLSKLDLSNNRNEIKNIATKEYTWISITSKYAELFRQ